MSFCMRDIYFFSLFSLEIALLCLLFTIRTFFFVVVVGGKKRERKKSAINIVAGIMGMWTYSPSTFLPLIAPAFRSTSIPGCLEREKESRARGKPL